MSAISVSPKEKCGGTSKSFSRIVCSRGTPPDAFARIAARFVGAGVGEEEFGRSSFAVRLTAESWDDHGCLLTIGCEVLSLVVTANFS